MDGLNESPTVWIIMARVDKAFANPIDTRNIRGCAWKVGLDPIGIRPKMQNTLNHENHAIVNLYDDVASHLRVCLSRRR